MARADLRVVENPRLSAPMMFRRHLHSLALELAALPSGREPEFLSAALALVNAARRGCDLGELRELERRFARTLLRGIARSDTARGGHARNAQC